MVDKLKYLEQLNNAIENGSVKKEGESVISYGELKTQIKEVQDQIAKDLTTAKPEDLKKLQIQLAAVNEIDVQVKKLSTNKKDTDFAKFSVIQKIVNGEIETANSELSKSSTASVASPASSGQSVADEESKGNPNNIDAILYVYKQIAGKNVKEAEKVVNTTLDNIKGSQDTDLKDQAKALALLSDELKNTIKSTFQKGLGAVTKNIKIPGIGGFGKKKEEPAASAATDDFGPTADDVAAKLVLIAHTLDFDAAKTAGLSISDEAAGKNQGILKQLGQVASKGTEKIQNIRQKAWNDYAMYGDKGGLDILQKDPGILKSFEKGAGIYKMGMDVFNAAKTAKGVFTSPEAKTVDQKVEAPQTIEELLKNHEKKRVSIDLKDIKDANLHSVAKLAEELSIPSYASSSNVVSIGTHKRSA